MSDSKTYVLDGGNQGVDPNLMAMMNGGCNGANAMWNNPLTD